MSNRWVVALTAALFFVLSFLILLHQKLTFGVWFQIGDLHHETFAIAAIAVGFGIIIGYLIAQENGR